MMEIKLILLSEVDLAEQSHSPLSQTIDVAWYVFFKETTEQIFY